MSTYLLDSHALLWFDHDPTLLSAHATSLMRDRENVLYVSSLTAWELSIKHKNGKLPEAAALVQDFYGTMARYGFLELSYTINDALRAASLPNTHKDPFDRGLCAQALERGIPLISTDVVLDQFQVDRQW
jgi:PIN domain nuclease of toxin-antitoxin system